MAIGLKRHIDSLGRISIPKDLRDYFELKAGSPVDIYCSKTQIIIEPSDRSCIFCGKLATVQFKDKGVCEECKITLLHSNF